MVESNPLEFHFSYLLLKVYDWKLKVRRLRDVEFLSLPSLCCIVYPTTKRYLCDATYYSEQQTLVHTCLA
uniref:Uncharacterized protein n=1 Tax=Trichobilharzia regenti TaxID=157069 RepID=A0AA85JXI7_TRIRE|nr:unnamed protein product [Trichobilharzia regenti]